LRKLRDAYEAAVKKANSLEKDWTEARDSRASLVEKRQMVQRRIDEHLRLGPALRNDAVVKKAYGDLLSQLAELDTQIDKYPTPEAIERQHRRSNEDVEGRRAAFAERVAAVRALVDRTRRAYTQLADDPAVAGIKEAHRGGATIKLGPSPGFLSRMGELEAIERSLSGVGSRTVRKSKRR
jgi:hypothetical protein